MNRSYKQLASHLDCAETDKSSGIIKGLYKGKKVEFRTNPDVFSGIYPMSQSPWSAWMQVDDPAKYKANDMAFLDDIRLSKGWLVCDLSFPVKKVLDKLYNAAIRFEDELVIKCFECGAEIEKKENKCSKCGWSWESTKTKETI